MSSPLIQAKTTRDILHALAGACWDKDHPGKDCPTDKIPAPGELHEWLPKCPPRRRGRACIASRGSSAPGAGHLHLVIAVCGVAVEFKDGALQTWDGFPDLDFAAVHAYWLPHRDKVQHPLAPIMRAWQERADRKPIKPNRRLDPTIPRVRIVSFT